jgi:hypothetical protein
MGYNVYAMKAYKRIELLQKSVRELQLFLQSCAIRDLCVIMHDNDIEKSVKYDNAICLAQDITNTLWDELLDIQIYMIDKGLQNDENMYVPSGIIELIDNTNLILPRPVRDYLQIVNHT